MIQRPLDKPRAVYVVVLIVITLSILFLVGRSLQLRNQVTLEKESSFVDNKPPQKSDHYKIRNDSAPITIINYISIDCVHCKKAYIAEDAFLASLPEEKRNINLIYRHNPLASQKLSQEKALISECVYQQGGDKAFFAFMSNVFSSYNEDQKDNLWVKNIATSHVTSQELLETCMRDEKTRNAIQQQKNENIIAEVNQTPSLLIFRNDTFVKRYIGVNERVVIEILKHYIKISQ